MAQLRILVVDDAVVMRKLITETLRQDPELEVVGTAANGRIALQKIPQVNPDLLTLDLEMPEMDGLTTLKELRKLYPDLPVIIFSTLSQNGAAATLDALALGANDYVTKPANVGGITEAMERLEQELIPKIKAHCRRRSPLPPAPVPVTPAFPSAPAAWAAAARVELVCIGTSTGGPNALAEVFRNLPADFPVPLVVVQHMPPMFTAMLAERLNTHSLLRCHEGADGQPVERGHAYLAPGGHHLEIARTAAGPRLRVHDGPLENSCRPAVDVLFRSVAANYGRTALGVIMTGMGQDGLRGCQLLREQGARIIAQDEASSIVWGMPGVVAQAGYAEKVLPLNLIAREITRQVRNGRAPL
jgi:two-component system chemotaxis response regulator CheB